MSKAERDIRPAFAAHGYEDTRMDRPAGSLPGFPITKEAARLLGPSPGKRPT